MTPQEFCQINNVDVTQYINVLQLYPGDEAAQLASLVSYQQGYLQAQVNALAAQLVALQPTPPS